MKIRLHLTEEKLKALTWGDMIAMEEAREFGRFNKVMRDLVARFMIDERGNDVALPDAVAYLTALNVEQMGQTINEFIQGLENVSARPTNGANSNAPLPSAEAAPGGSLP